MWLTRRRFFKVIPIDIRVVFFVLCSFGFDCAFCFSSVEAKNVFELDIEAPGKKEITEIVSRRASSTQYVTRPFNGTHFREDPNSYDSHESIGRSSPTVTETADSVTNSKHLLSRRKRFLAFPEGSSFSCAVCLTTGVLGNPNYQFLSMGLNWGIAYNLPNASWVLNHARGEQKEEPVPDSGASTDNVTEPVQDAVQTMKLVNLPIVKRRSRRDLYGKLETLINGIDRIDSIDSIDSIDNCTIINEIEQFKNQTAIVSETIPVNYSNGMIYQLLQDTNEVHDLWFSPATHINRTSPGQSTNNNNDDEAVDIRRTSIRTPSSSSSSAARQSFNSNISLSSSPRQHILSRSKRYLAFPEGSSFSVAVCFTVGIIGNPSFNYMSFGLNWGVAYDLPNITWVLNHLHGFSRHPVPAVRRRSRRSLYQEIEVAVDNMGYKGRDCVLRALCESKKYFRRNKMGMIGEMLRVVFSMPKQRIFTREIEENEDIELYDQAFKQGTSVDCIKEYDCSFSLLELAFGKYSEPPHDYYKNHNSQD